jgi:hypothetical protein
MSVGAWQKTTPWADHYATELLNESGKIVGESKQAKKLPAPHTAQTRAESAPAKKRLTKTLLAVNVLPIVKGESRQ